MFEITRNISPAFLANLLKKELPGSEAHKKMLPMGRSITLPSNASTVKYSAVLLLLFEKDNELHFCLTKRNNGLKHHAGQISFPGGRCEPFEKDFSTTALRETEEEIGVHRNEIQLLGSLSEVYVQVSNYLIKPYIGFCHQHPNFKINPFEVDEVISVPLSLIFTDGSHQTKDVTTSIGTIKAPCYQLAEHTVWGATAMMLAELEELLK